MEQHTLMTPGWIEVICGPMFGGKSDEAAKRVAKENISGERAKNSAGEKFRHVFIFAPRCAERQVTINDTGEQINTGGKLVSRSGKSYKAIEFDENNPEQILTYVRSAAARPTTVVIEEAHFCSMKLIEVCEELAEADDLRLRVIVVGLDQNFKGQGFGPIPQLMVKAEFVTKELAVCDECGAMIASTSWLDTRARELAKNDILAGDKQYKALCRHCKKKYIQRYES